MVAPLSRRSAIIHEMDFAILIVQKSPFYEGAKIIFVEGNE